jgi:hypothetical protein
MIRNDEGVELDAIDKRKYFFSRMWWMNDGDDKGRWGLRVCQDGVNPNLHLNG